MWFSKIKQNNWSKTLLWNIFIFMTIMTFILMVIFLWEKLGVSPTCINFLSTALQTEIYTTRLLPSPHESRDQCCIFKCRTSSLANTLHTVKLYSTANSYFNYTSVNTNFDLETLISWSAICIIINVSRKYNLNSPNVWLLLKFHHASCNFDLAGDLAVFVWIIIKRHHTYSCVNKGTQENPCHIHEMT